MLREASFSDPFSVDHGILQHWSVGDQVDLLSRLLMPTRGALRARQLSESMVQRFGSLLAVLSAPAARLQEIPGVGRGTILILHATREAAQKIARERVRDERQLLTCSSQLVEYLQLSMAHLDVEQSRILFLDKKNRLIADEVHQRGTIDHCNVYPREIIKRAFELSATALIVAHNHPSGCPTPSAADVRMTQELENVARPLGIALHDHIVVGKFGSLSLRSAGLMGDRNA